MRRFGLSKALLLTCALIVFCYSVNARPEFLALFAADPYSRPELRSKCSVCHINPAGGGERNEFGKAFAAAGFKITPELRAAWPDRFVPPGQPAPPRVTFVSESQHQVILEYGGKKLLINTRDRTVSELPAEVNAAPAPVIAQSQPRQTENVYVPVDVRLVNLPTAVPIPKGSLWTDFTHRFPFGDLSQASQLLGLDSFAAPSFGVTYGLTYRVQVGVYRSPTLVGRPIEMFAGIHLLDETRGQPLTVMARVGLEGRDNFQRNFTTSFEATVAKSITRHAQVYVVPTVSIGDRPIGQPEVNLPGTTAVALGVGAAVNVRPSVALMAEVNYRFNEDSRYEVPGPGIRRPVFGFGLQKASSSRRHAFSLVFTNGPGTTFAQRSMTNALLFTDDSFKNLSIGFNLTRRIF